MNATFNTASVQIYLPNLVRNAVGEYTARSVIADPLDASTLHLVRQTDGNFVGPAESFLAPSQPAGRAAVGFQAALQGLSLGG